MFKNLILFTYRLESAVAVAELCEKLESIQFRPCQPSEDHSSGLISPRGTAGSQLVERLDGGSLIMKAQMQKKVVPSSAVKEILEEKCAQIEASTGRRPGRKEKADLKEQVRLELLPSVIPKNSTCWIWMNPAENLLAVSMNSLSAASEVVGMLIKAIDGLFVTNLVTAESPSSCMAAWLNDGIPPESFTIDRDCELRGEDEMKSVVRYRRHNLDTDEVRKHLAEGKAPVNLAMTWSSRVSFQVTDAMVIKGIKYLDLVYEGVQRDAAAEAFDADATIATGELGKLIPALVSGFGGMAAPV